MLPILVPIAHLYGINDWLLDRCVSDYQPADWLVRDPAGHDARWLVGHVTVYRRRIAAMLGVGSPSDAWDAAFQRGTRPEAVPADVDAVALVQAFHAAQLAMLPRWDLMTEAELATPLGRTLPDGGDTVGAGLRFLQWHETYHLGQLGLLRRLVGKPGVA